MPDYPWMSVVRDERFRKEADEFLKDAQRQEGAIDPDELAELRTSRLPLELTGSSERVRLRTNVLLPLAERPIQVRVYRDRVALPQPLLLWLHGGAFVGGTLDDVDVVCAGLARRARLTVISLDYRLAPEDAFPAALSDTYETLTWLEEHGEAFGGDGRLLAGGQSSGGNLVAAACLMVRDRGGPDVTTQLLCYPWLDFGTDSDSHRLFDGIDGVMPTRDQWFLEQYLGRQSVTPYAAPLTARDLKGVPPAIILGAGLDPLRDDARRYAQRLDQAGIGVSYIEYDDTPHAFLNFAGALSVAWRAIDDVAAHLTALVG